MLKLLLTRITTSDQGTVGIIQLPTKYIFILELPERTNEKQFSRIPEETYLCSWKKSPKFGWTYQVMGVSGRGNILLHAGNMAGDVRLGFISHSHGCLLPCLKIGRMNKQLAGLLSRPALQELYRTTNKQDFILEIKNA